MDFGDFVGAPPVGADADADADVELDRKLYTMLEIEQRRYEGFFAALDEPRVGALPRAAALAFFAKSALSEQEVAELYALVKSLHVLADPDAISAPEFAAAMHLIVCRTKRSLAKLPRAFPTYLFPTLNLTPQHAAFAISSMPSPEKESEAAAQTGRASGFSQFAGANDADSRVLSGVALEKLQEAATFTQLLEKETHNRRAETRLLENVQQSEHRALQQLRACVDLVAENVEKIGYPVPATARALDALDDFGNLLRSHVQATKQEIQSLEISARMRSVALEVSGGGGAREEEEKDADVFREIAQLTQQLSALQTQAAQLSARKKALQQQVSEKRASAPRKAESAAPAEAGAGAGADFSWGNFP